MGVKSMMIGAVAGYVLGAKAGRERYEKIAAVSSTVWNSRPVQAAATKARNIAGEAVGKVQAAAGDTFEQAKARFSDAEETVDVDAVEF